MSLVMRTGATTSPVDAKGRPPDELAVEAFAFALPFALGSFRGLTTLAFGCGRILGANGMDVDRFMRFAA